MEVYQVIQDCAIVPAGTLVQLSDTQANSRRLQLRAFPGNWFMALVNLTFETNEVVTFCTLPDPETLRAFTPPELTEPLIFRFNNGCPQAKKEQESMIDTREDMEIFFNPEEFGVEAWIQARPVKGLMGSASIISNDVETQKTTFTCPNRSVRGIQHGEKVRVAEQAYRIVGIQQEGAGLTVLILEVG